MYIWQRDADPSHFMKTLPILPTLSFKICPTLHSPISSWGMGGVPPSSQTCAHPSHLEKSSPGDSPLTIFLEFHTVFSFQKLLTCRSHMLIKFNKTKFFPWNTKNNDRNGMYKQNTQTCTKHWEKDNIGKG